MHIADSLPNRVDPFGRFVAVAARGAVMGNRGGRLHDDQRQLTTRRWVSRRWICCLLSFKGRRRQVWGRSYTELFFLDEVVALAAGHRPCAECRRQAFLSYGEAVGIRLADDIDRRLHGERIGQAKDQVRLPDLPDGAVAADGDDAYVRRGSRVFRFSWHGWQQMALPAGTLRLLTPHLSVQALSHGYSPVWHSSAS